MSPPSSLSIGLAHQRAGEDLPSVSIHASTLGFNQLGTMATIGGAAIACDNMTDRLPRGSLSSEGELELEMRCGGLSFMAEQYFLVSCMRSNQDFPLFRPRPPRIVRLVEEVHPERLTIEGTLSGDSFVGVYLFRTYRFCGPGSEQANSECSRTLPLVGKGHLGTLTVEGAIRLTR